MAHLTTCTTCGRCYEDVSEEQANAPVRECISCSRVRRDDAAASAATTITLPDGYNGHTVELYAEPIRRDGDHVLLRCAEPGREFLIRWAHVGDLL